MFKFLKEKLKSAISKISEGVEKEGRIEEKTAVAPVEEKKSFFAKIKETFTGKKDFAEEKPAIKEEKVHEKPIFREETRPAAPEPKKTETEKPKVEEKKAVKHAHRADEVQKHETKKPEEKIHKPAGNGEIREIPKPVEEKEEKRGFFEAIKEKIITTKISNEQFEKLFWDMELALMENNVAVEVIEKIKSDLKNELVEKPIRRNKVEETVEMTLKNSIEDLFEISKISLLEEIKNKKEKPYIIAFFGINGSGKTTSIAKIAHMLQSQNISCVLAASDTFRAASIEQLQQHADKLNTKLIKHDYGADPAAVAFDAIKHAKAKNIDVVLIDTAGRMHSNINLIEEMKKIIRVAKPDLKIFVGESITGNDCIEQAKAFNDSVGIDGIILAKADIDEKGGAAISISYVTKKPILYFGTGQNYSDIEQFDKEKIMRNIGLA